MFTTRVRKLAATGFAAALVGGLALAVSPLSAEAATHTCNGYKATIVGTNGNDDIEGTSGRDVIVGLGGHDEIDGNGGNDVICAGSGNDEVDGGSGNDYIHAGSGHDQLEGSSGNDRIYGADGNDHVEGESGNDTVYGNDGHDLVEGGPAAGDAAGKDYTDNRYHKPGDQYDAATWKLDGIVQDLQTVYSVGETLAAGGEWPNWNEGNPFKAARDKMRPTAAPASASP